MDHEPPQRRRECRFGIANLRAIACLMGTSSSHTWLSVRQFDSGYAPCRHLSAAIRGATSRDIQGHTS